MPFMYPVSDPDNELCVGEFIFSKTNTKLIDLLGAPVAGTVLAKKKAKLKSKAEEAPKPPKAKAASKKVHVLVSILGIV